MGGSIGMFNGSRWVGGSIGMFEDLDGWGDL